MSCPIEIASAADWVAEYGWPGDSPPIERRPVDDRVDKLRGELLLLEQDRNEWWRRYWEAKFVISGDEDAAAGEIDQARRDERTAIGIVTQIEGHQYLVEAEIKQLTSPALPNATPIRVASRPLARPRERRPGRRRRRVARAGPGDDPGGDGEEPHDVAGWRRRGWAR